MSLEAEIRSSDQPETGREPAGMGGRRGLEGAELPRPPGFVCSLGPGRCLDLGVGDPSRAPPNLRSHEWRACAMPGKAVRSATTTKPSRPERVRGKWGVSRLPSQSPLQQLSAKGLPPKDRGRNGLRCGRASIPPPPHPSARCHPPRRPPAPPPGPARPPCRPLTIVVVADFLFAASLTVRHGLPGLRRLRAPPPAAVAAAPAPRGEKRAVA